VIRIPDRFSPAPRFGFEDGDIVASALAAQDWPEEPITIDVYKKKARKVNVESLDGLRTVLRRMHLSGRVGVAFEIKRYVRVVPAVAYDEIWPIVL